MGYRVPVHEVRLPGLDGQRHRAARQLGRDHVPGHLRPRHLDRGDQGGQVPANTSYTVIVTMPILPGLEVWSALPSSCWARGSGVSSGCSKIIRTLGSFSKFSPTQVRFTGTWQTLMT